MSLQTLPVFLGALPVVGRSRAERNGQRQRSPSTRRCVSFFRVPLLRSCVKLDRHRLARYDAALELYDAGWRATFMLDLPRAVWLAPSAHLCGFVRGA